MSYKEKVQKLAEELQLDESVISTMSSVIEACIAEGIASRETQIAEEIKQAIDEYKDEFEQQVIAEATEAVQEYIDERQEEFNTSPEFQANQQFVNNIVEALQGLGVEHSQHIIGENERIAELESEIANLREQVENQQGLTYLTTALSESNLSVVQREKVMGILAHTQPGSIDEFKSIVDTLINEYKSYSDDGKQQNINENLQTPKPHKQNERLNAVVNSLNKMNSRG